MNKVARIFLALVVLIAVGFVASYVLVARIPPATIGVKQNLWGGSGVIEKDYQTGFHMGVTGIHKWHTLDRRTHFLTFADAGPRKRRSSNYRREPALEVRTKDNNRATYDVTVAYRIIPGQGHALVREGLKDIYRDRVVAGVESVLREELAQLSSEELYSTDQRLRVAREAMPKLEREMASYYVKPESILIRALRFPPAYETKLQEKQLTYQKRLLAQANKAVEDQEAVTQTMSAEIEAAQKELRGDWDKRLQEAQSDNQVAIAQIMAEANVYDRRVRAEADASFDTDTAIGRLAIDKAEALRNELRNQALDTLGGRIYLAKQAAENLRVDHVTLNSNDPKVPSILDINELVTLLVGDSD